MHTPPPYPPPGPKKSNTTVLILAAVGVVGVCCLGVVGLGAFGLFKVGQQAWPLAECAVSVEAARDAMHDYAAEHNGKLPPAEGWEDAIRPYYKKNLPTDQMQEGPVRLNPMPVEGPWGCRRADGGFTGLAYNKEVAGKELQKLASDSVILFEVESQGRNLVQPYKRQDASKSPLIMGERRGWFVARRNGEPDLEGASGSTKIRTRQ